MGGYKIAICLGILFLRMPRSILVKPRKLVHGKKGVTRSAGKQLKTDQHKNWLISMKRITGSGYLERFFRQEDRCTYIEYGIEDNSDGTHSLYGYFQLSQTMPRSALVGKFNCKTEIHGISIAEKLVSEYHLHPAPKISLGVENINARMSGTGVMGSQALLVPVQTKIVFNSVNK